MREALQARAGLGRTLVLMNRSAEAAAYLDEAAEEYEHLGQPTERARLDLVRVELLLENGRPREAQALAAAALSAVRNRPAVACMARYHLARAALAMGELHTAETELSVALDAAEDLGITPLRADLLHSRALVHRAAGRNAAAVADLRRAVEDIERVRGSLQAERFRAAFHGNRLAIYEDLVVAALDAGGDDSCSIAFATVERAKGRSLLDLARGALDTNQRTASETTDNIEAGLAAELDQARAELNAWYSRLADVCFVANARVPADDLRDQIRLGQHRLEALESRLATTRGTAGLHARPSDLPAVQATLKPDAALVEYYVAGGELLAFVLRRDSVKSFRGLARIDELTLAVQRVHFQIRRALRPGATDGRRANRLVADAQRELGTLHQVLLAPLQDALRDTPRLIIVPHGVLHTIPFHALWDERRYLIEDREVTYAPSASLRTYGRDAAESGAVAKEPLVIGVSDKRAPLIEDEARQVAAALRTDRVLLGAAAVAELFKELAPEAGIIHLAAHGHFSTEDPQGSGIKFSDRWLTVGEICELGLTARLVTLAACETGRNVIASGDELLGLTRGFIAGGARTLIASLWAVSDESSGSLMTSFYNAYGSVRDGGGAAAALRSAQLTALSARPHPAFWAPYILVGE